MRSRTVKPSTSLQPPDSTQHRDKCTEVMWTPVHSAALHTVSLAWINHRMLCINSDRLAEHRGYRHGDDTPKERWRSKRGMATCVPVSLAEVYSVSSHSFCHQYLIPFSPSQSGTSGGNPPWHHQPFNTGTKRKREKKGQPRTKELLNFHCRYVQNLNDFFEMSINHNCKMSEIT